MSAKHTVLLIEDNASDAKLLIIFLSKIYEVIWLKGIQEAIVSIPTIQPKLIILDLSLPDSEGLDTIDVFVQRFPDIPVIVWTGAGTAAEAMHHGADNFILKREACWDFIPKIIAEAIVRHRTSTIRRDLKAVQKIASPPANTDSAEQEKLKE